MLGPQLARRVSGWRIAVGLFVALLVPVAGSFAQSGRAAGTVRDDTGRPLKGAMVVAENPLTRPIGLAAATDERGRFAFVGLERGSWTFRASAHGFETVELPGEVSSGRSNASLDFRLTRVPGAPPAPPLAGVDLRELQGQLDAAETLLGARQYARAISAYEAVLARAPKLTLVHLQIGNAYRASGQPEKALAAYRALLASEPGNARGLFAVGMTLSEQGKEAEAEASLLKAAEADPAWTKPPLKLGALAWDRGDREAAARYFDRVVALAPSSADAAEAKAAMERKDEK